MARDKVSKAAAAAATTVTADESSSAAGADGAKEELPPLSYGILTNEDERRTGLRLITDSIAQQSQLANFSIIFNPLCIAGLASALAAMLRARGTTDLGTTLITISGTIICYLAAIRMLTSRFIRMAESFNPDDFLTGPEGRQDIVIGARFDNEIIGCLILRPYLSDTDFHKQSKASSSKISGGSIRAWTVRLKFRNKGVGGDLLRFAVTAIQTLQGKDAKISFDRANAHSNRLPIPMLNRPFDKRDERAAAALIHAELDCESRKVDFDQSFKNAVRHYVKSTGK